MWESVAGFRVRLRDNGNPLCVKDYSVSLFRADNNLPLARACTGHNYVDGVVARALLLSSR